jgi:hypothetical protein
MGLPEMGAELAKKYYRPSSLRLQSVRQSIEELDRGRQELDFIAHAEIYHA